MMVVAAPCNAATLLFENNVPTADTTGVTYLSGVQAIADAIDAGHRVHVSMTYPQNGGTAHFVVELTAIACSVGFPGPPNTVTDPNPAGTLDYCSGILSMRPRIDPQADAIGTNVLIGASVNTLGQYWYIGPTGVLQVQQTYANSWWAD